MKKLIVKRKGKGRSAYLTTFAYEVSKEEYYAIMAALQNRRANDRYGTFLWDGAQLQKVSDHA